MNRLVIIALIVGVVIGIGGGYSIVQLQLNDIRSIGEELEVAISRHIINIHVFHTLYI